MKSNIDINDEVLLKAQKLTGAKTSKTTIKKASQLLIRLKKQKKFFKLWGKVELDDKAFE